MIAKRNCSMALFELTFAVAGGAWDVVKFSDAVVEAGFPDAIVGTGRRGTLSVQVEHIDSSFEQGKVIADKILRHLPEDVAFVSTRQALHISELDDEFIDAILATEYGKVAE
jgi:hypothetical protein